MGVCYSKLQQFSYSQTSTNFNMKIYGYCLLFLTVCAFYVLRLFQNQCLMERRETVKICSAPQWTGMETYDAYFVREPDCSKFAKAKNLIYVYTAIGHFKRRTKLREKFNELSLKDGDFKMLFVIGAPSPEKPNKLESQELSKEFDNFGDLLQIGVFDKYTNLGYKGLFTFNWTLSCISDLKLLVKIDDEESNILTDIFNKSKELIAKKPDLTGAIFCTVPFGGAPLRNYIKKRWIATIEQYPDKFYPPYCLGNSGMFLSPSVADKLLQASKGKPVYHIDDVYVSGLLREKSCLKLEKA